jgi:hypothetical protein
MKKNLVRHLFTLLISCFAISIASAQAGKPVMKVTIPGYPTFVCTDDAVMPLGATGGLVTITKAADNLDQQFNTAMKNKTAYATLDIVVTSAPGGPAPKTKSYHFTKLVVKSVVANVNKISAIGLSFENMTEK